MDGWVEACKVGEIDAEDVLRFDHAAVRSRSTVRLAENSSPRKVFAHMSTRIWLTAW